MNSIVQILKNQEDFIGGSGCDLEAIKDTERQIGTNFAEEYREYLKQISLTCFDGHEFTGITDDPRLDVVKVTIEERQHNLKVPDNWYVIEQTNIDGIVIWQANSGEIYQTCSGGRPRKLCNSLADFIQDKY